MKVAAFGDLFVRAEILEEALRRRLGEVGLGDNLEIVSRESNWPDTPLQHNAEVSEFVGEADQVVALAHDADAILTHVAPVTRAILEQCPHVRIIGCCRGGAVNLNVAAANERRIPVVNSPGRNAQAVIEFTLGIILSEVRGIARAHAALSRGEWQGELYRFDRMGRELRGQTIGLVGCGAIAQGLIPYLRPFGMQIITFDPYLADARAAALGVEKTTLEDLLRRSDIVSIHARVTPETRGMIGAPQLALMKPTAYLVNTARGPLLDYDALYTALAAGGIAGAALDTFAQEPPPADWPLLRLPNVTVTPHIAGASRGAAELGADQVAEDFANFFAGRPLVRCINAREI